MYVDDTSHVRAHGVDGGMRSKPEEVDAQIRGTLLHHLTNDVYFYLHTARKEENPVVNSE